MHRVPSRTALRWRAGAVFSGTLARPICGDGRSSSDWPRATFPIEAAPNSVADGGAFFGRASAERAGWRGHVIFWRGRNFIKDEGDPNYLSLARSGDRYRGTRDYAEAGLTRRFTLARAAVLDVSGRVHRVEGRYQVLVPDRERAFRQCWKIR